MCLHSVVKRLAMGVCGDIIIPGNLTSIDVSTYEADLLCQMIEKRLVILVVGGVVRTNLGQVDLNN